MRAFFPFDSWLWREWQQNTLPEYSWPYLEE